MEADSSVCVQRYPVYVKNSEIFIDYTESAEKEKKWRDILRALESGADPENLSRQFGLPEKEVRDTVRRFRVGERLIWLGKLYQEQGFIGPVDLLRIPKRDEKGIPYSLLSLLDDLTSQL